MIANHTIEFDDARLIDALVDGELSDPRRADLLRRLELSPGGWRQLSLAFLEAQSWQQALRAESSVRQASPKTAERRTSRRAIAWTGAWAVSAALAFSVGLALNGRSQPGSAMNAATTTAPVPVMVRDSKATTPTFQSSAMAQTLSPAARQQLERLGFRVQERPRVVSFERPDGQTVQVLVHEVELHFVGRQFSL
jgi:hypothetical protein